MWVYFVEFERIAVRQAGRSAAKGQTTGVEFGETILGLPEKAGQEVQRIFVTSAKEPTFVGLLVEVRWGHCSPREEVEVGPIERRFGVTGGEVGQEARKRHPADATADRPTGAHLFIASQVAVLHSKLALDVGEVVIAECTDHEVGANRRELIVATAADSAEVATAAVRMGALKLNARRSIEVLGVFLVPHAETAAAADVATGP